MANYWSNLIRERTLSRRRALALSATGLTGAALLAACGGGEESGPTDKSGLLFQPSDTTNKAVAGGTLTIHADDYTNIDPVTDQNRHGNGPPTYVYSRLIKFKPVAYPGPASFLGVEPDGAQSWEKSPDGLTYTFKIRPDLKFDPRAPLNGRNVTIQDVKYSMDKFAEGVFTRGGLMKSVDPTAPIEAYSTPDSSTFVIKMAYPFTLLEHYLANPKYVYILPVESEDKIDLKTTMRGSGAWMLDKIEPSVGWEFSRNPNWYIKGHPFYEKASLKIIPEYATRLAQMQAGNVDILHESSTHTPPIQAKDALSLKQARPQINMVLRQPGDGNTPVSLAFDLRSGSPFLDVRVRRAINMLLDREAFIDTFFNVTALRAAGLSLDTFWHSNFGAGGTYWIDPRAKEFGEAGQYFQFNIAEAKKLLQAASFPLDREFPFWQQVNPQADLLAGFLRDNGGFKLKVNIVPSAQTTSLLNQTGGAHEGISYTSGFSGGDLDQHLTLRFLPGSGPTVLYDKTPVPPEFNKFIDMIKRSRIEPDSKKRIEFIKTDLQKEMALQMPSALHPGVSPFLNFAQPWVSNWATQVSVGLFDRQELFQNYWYDASKKT